MISFSHIQARLFEINSRIFLRKQTVLKGRRQLGMLKDQLSVGPEFFEPLPSEDLDAWE